MPIRLRWHTHMNFPILHLVESHTSNTRTYHLKSDDDFEFPIPDLAEFYSSMGFQQSDSRRLLPNEFLWERFTKHSSKHACASCFQMRAIDYLLRHSKLFSERYSACINRRIKELIEQKQVCSEGACPEKHYCGTLTA